MLSGDEMNDERSLIRRYLFALELKKPKLYSAGNTDLDILTTHDTTPITIIMYKAIHFMH